jgi:hypothetical protein
MRLHAIGNTLREEAFQEEMTEEEDEDDDEEEEQDENDDGSRVWGLVSSV